MNKITYLITGATGGIGQALIARLATHNARVIAVSRSTDKLQNLVQQYQEKNLELLTYCVDINQFTEQDKLIKEIRHDNINIDYFIHLAGVQYFSQFEQLEVTQIQDQVHVNLTVPMVLTNKILPILKKQTSAHIAYIGSTFGSIGFPDFSAYCASKFGIRGFCESLRRELKDSHIKVSYIAPRATNTNMNSSDLQEFAKQTNMNMDEPEIVAGQIIHAIHSGKKNHFIGFPERFFVKINAFLPSLVDSALGKKHKIATQILNRQR